MGSTDSHSQSRLSQPIVAEGGIIEPARGRLELFVVLQSDIL